MLGLAKPNAQIRIRSRISAGYMPEWLCVLQSHSVAIVDIDSIPPVEAQLPCGSAKRKAFGSEWLMGPMAAPVPGQTACVVQTLTTDLIIALHANKPYTDSK
jgi:hypothetical protein